MEILRLDALEIPIIGDSKIRNKPLLEKTLISVKKGFEKLKTFDFHSRELFNYSQYFMKFLEQKNWTLYNERNTLKFQFLKKPRNDPYTLR